VGACRRATPVSHPTRVVRVLYQRAKWPRDTPHPNPISAMSHRGDLDTSTSAPQSLAPSPFRSRTWMPLRSGGRPVLTPERDAARAAPRPESTAASCGSTPPQQPHCSPEGCTAAGRARRYRCRGCVPGSPHRYKNTLLYHPK
jgi:hypothetical protein